MKSLLFLLLLDYSGSMDQKLEGKTKIQSLKSEVRGLLSTASSEQNSGALVFGLDAKQGCERVDWFEEKSSALSHRLSQTPAGKFGKTPLALGLKKTIEKSKDYGPETSVLVVTDGADSCGQDPCKALQEGDRVLEGHRKLKINIVGYDLKNDAAKLKCLKDLKLKNIDVQVMAAEGNFDLQQMLKAGQKSRLDLDEVNDVDNLDGVKGGKVVGRRASQGLKGKNDQPLRKPYPSPDEALIEITGAPAEAQFVATSSKGVQRKWFGSYVIDLKPGTHTIAFKDTNSVPLKIPMSGGTLTKVPWARLMKLSSGQVAVQVPLLSLKWTASEQTQQIHGEVAEVITPVKLNGESLVVPPLPFGEWQVEVVQPQWLLGKLPIQKFKVDLGGKSSINLANIFGSDLKWIDNPNINQPGVIRMTGAGLQESRYLVPIGQVKIPVIVDTKVEWLTK